MTHLSLPVDPTFATFEVTSGSQEDVTGFLGEVKALVHDAAFVLVSQTSL